MSSSRLITENDLKAILENMPVSSIPGEIKAYAGENIPGGWLECNGEEKLVADYPLLYNAILDSWGTPSDSDHFVLPNLKGKTLVGFDNNDTDFKPVGKHDKGSKYIQEHTHAHTNPTVGSNSHTHQYGYMTQQRGTGSSNTRVGPYGWQSSGVTTIGSSEYTHSHTLTGGGVGNINTSGLSVGQDGNLQPYAVVKYIIRAV